MSDDDRKPKRGRPRTMSDAAMLDVALTAYLKADPADVSLNAICQMAGVSKPSLYRAFGSEDGLTLASLDLYSERVLTDIFTILQRGETLGDTLAALTDFAVDNPKLETGCLFYKMRAGKHRLGPRTRARIDEIDAAAVGAFEAFLIARCAAGDWTGGHSAVTLARYLVEQIGLALTQRAALEDAAQIRASLDLAFSVVRGS